VTRLLQDRRVALGFSLGFLLALGYVDYLTAFEFDLFLFYAFPVAITAWCIGRVPAVLTALFSMVVWFGANVFWTNPYSSRFFEYWNTGLKCGWVLIVALTISRIREDLERERQLNGELAEALNQVRQLSGLLPMCAWCKSVRNDEGYWEEVGEYLSKHTDAQFTHGICPTCRTAQFMDRRQDQR
jgi:K+-sensing histidine kinase KdpD